jgi:hypothetical protein
MKYKSYTGTTCGVPSTVHLEFFVRVSAKTAGQEDVSTDFTCSHLGPLF